jgi:hypothetical protein
MGREDYNFRRLRQLLPSGRVAQSSCPHRYVFGKLPYNRLSGEVKPQCRSRSAQVAEESRLFVHVGSRCIVGKRIGDLARSEKHSCFLVSLELLNRR